MSTNEPLVSIIINCFNGEKYLEECLRSIKQQTYKNIEVIFWDNKSTDKSAKIFKNIKSKNFFYYFSQKHTTLYEARNLAFKKTTGDFISFLDVDDFWSETKIEKQVNTFLEENDLGVVYCNQSIYDNRSNKKKKYINKFSNKVPESIKILNRVGATLLTSLIKKEYFLKFKNGFIESYNIIGDLDILYKLSKICVFKYIDEELAVYRLHEDNYSKEKKEEEIKELEHWYNEHFKKINNFNNAEQQAIYNTILLRKCILYILKKRKRKALETILKLDKNLIKFKLILSLMIPRSFFNILLKF